MNKNKQTVCGNANPTCVVKINVTEQSIVSFQIHLQSIEQKISKGQKMASVCNSLRRPSFLFSVTSDGGTIECKPRTRDDPFPYRIKLKNVRRVIQFSDREEGVPPVFDRDVTTADLVCWWGKAVQRCCEGRNGCTFADLPPNAVLTHVPTPSCAPRSLGVILRDAWLRRDKCGKCSRKGSNGKCFRDLVFRASIVSDDGRIPKHLCSVSLFIDNGSQNVWGIGRSPGLVSTSFSFANLYEDDEWTCVTTQTGTPSEALTVATNVVTFNIGADNDGTVSMLFSKQVGAQGWPIEMDHQNFTLSSFQCNTQIAIGNSIQVKLLLNGYFVRTLLQPSGQPVDYFYVITSDASTLVVPEFKFNLDQLFGPQIATINTVELQFVPLSDAPGTFPQRVPITFLGFSLTAITSSTT
jgi:hypothetical protein